MNKAYRFSNSAKELIKIFNSAQSGGKEVRKLKQLFEITRVGTLNAFIILGVDNNFLF